MPGSREREVGDETRAGSAQLQHVLPSKRNSAGATNNTGGRDWGLNCSYVP